MYYTLFLKEKIPLSLLLKLLLSLLLSLLLVVQVLLVVLSSSGAGASSSGAGASGAAASGAGANDPIIIIGKNGTVIIRGNDKNNFVNTNGTDQGEIGCWSLDSVPEWKTKLKDGNFCAVTSITLPSDISATAWTTSWSWGGLCQKTQVKNTKGELQLAKGTTHNFTDPVCGFLFKKV